MLRYLELRVTEEDTLLYQFVCWTPNAFLFFFFVFLRSITFLYSLLVLVEYLLWCEEHTFAHSETFKKSAPFALKKIRWYERSTNAHEQQKRSSLGRRFRASHFLRTLLPLPLLCIPFIYILK